MKIAMTMVAWGHGAGDEDEVDGPPLGATLDACPSPRISAMHPSVTHSLTF